MNEVDVTKEIVSLIKKSADTGDSMDAMRFAQAALSAAHAMKMLRATEEDSNKKST